MQQTHGLSERRACGLIRIARSSQRYRSQRRPDQDLRTRLGLLAQQRPRFGYRRLTVLLRREGLAVNHKRVYRLYQQQGLAVRHSRRKRVGRTRRPVPSPPSHANACWSLDYLADSLASGRQFRTLNIIDVYTRECLAIEVDTSLPGARVIRVLEALRSDRGVPQRIVLDNGPELTSRVVDQWAASHAVALDFIEPGKPIQNAYIESFNGKFRDECLNQHWFTSLAEARQLIEAWRRDCNQQRPHSALAYATPQEFAHAITAPPSAQIQGGLS